MRLPRTVNVSKNIGFSVVATVDQPNLQPLFRELAPLLACPICVALDADSRMYYARGFYVLSKDVHAP